MGYDAEPGGVGKLAAVVSAPDSRLKGPCGILHTTLSDGNRSGRSFKYNAIGEVVQVSECTDGETFVTDYGYDNSGRQTFVRYPQVGASRLEVENHFTSTGYLHYVKDVSTDTVLWAATAMNVLGQVTAEYTRNGVETTSNRNPATGWLMGTASVAPGDGDALIQGHVYRFDELGNLTRGREAAPNGVVTMEDFTYDQLNRLKTSRVRTSGGYNVSSGVDYDATGNIMFKGSTQYAYNTCGAGPHAVCAAGTSAAFEYDSNGSMTSGNSRTIEYNGSHKPRHIDSHPAVSQGNDTGVVDFIYGAEGDRVVQSVGTYPDTELARTVYVGLSATGKSLYERTKRGSTVEHTQFIYAGGTHGGNAFALRVVTEAPSVQTAEALKYYHFDHLGSVTAMSDEYGHVVADGPAAGAIGYDPWGARRNPDGTQAEPASFNLQVGHREFTGHEVIPNVGLINMNGRVYDPVLSRFLSADPVIQTITDLQSFNPYSYVLNNPLRYTDPTGYFFEGGFDLAVNVALTIGAIYICAQSTGSLCGPAFALATAIFNSASAINDHATFEQVLATNAVGLFAGQLGSGFTGLAQQAYPNSAVAQMIGGALAGATSAAFTSLLLKQSIGWDVLTSAAQGAAEAGLQWTAKKSAPLSRMSAALAETERRLGKGGPHPVPAVGSTRSLTAAEAAVVTADLERARKMIQRTIDALIRWDRDDRANFKEWFGTTSIAARDDILFGFENMRTLFANLTPANYQFDSSLAAGHFSAATHPDNPALMDIGSRYFDDIGPKTRAGTLIHEASHLNIIGATNSLLPDLYFQPDARRLARVSPTGALDNASNWEYFAANTR